LLLEDLFLEDLLQERTASGDIAQASFYDLPFKSHSFDTILNVGGYRYVSRDHMLTFWDEMDRVLRPGGKLIIGQFYPRIKSLEGTNIQHDIRLIPQSFTLESTTSFDAKLGPQYVKLRSGTYKTFAFRHTDTQVI
jgi:ubiquinone/menaquinone biosynthesis C-methylase UbiE